MKKIRLLFTKYLTALVFLLFLGVFFLGSLRPFAGETLKMISSLRSGYFMGISDLEEAYNKRLPGKETLITLNGGWNRLLGRRYLNERYKLDNGQLTYIIARSDMTGLCGQVTAFRDALAERDIPLIFTSTPFKVHRTDRQLPPGVEDFSNDNADQLMELLQQQGINTVDLRELADAEGLDHYSLFYPTDHHWKAEMGFWAYNHMIDQLISVDPGFAVDPRIRDFGNYTNTIYEGIFLGSAGKRVGTLYAGMDDISVIEPAYPTSLSLSVPALEIEKNGSFGETVLFKEKLTEGSPFQVSRYQVYCGDEYGLLQLRNHSAQEGLEIQSTPRRLVVIKDSFCDVVIPFLALSYDEIDFLDLRKFDGDLMAHIDSFAPDAVAIFYNPGAYEATNLQMFNFLP